MGSWVVEVQAAGAEADVPPEGGGGVAGIVFGIADDGAADVGELYADLVMASGVQPDFQFRYAWQSRVFAGEVTL